MTLFRSKVDRLMQGTYVCADCANEKSKVAGGKRASVELKKAVYQTAFGAYFGQGDTTKLLVRLLKGGRCKIESASVGTADPDLAWQIEGSYSENAKDEGKGVKSITFVVESCGSGVSPHTVGSSVDIAVEKGASNETLVCDGITCSSQIGKPEHELSLLMKTLQVKSWKLDVAVGDPVYAEIGTIFTLQQMQTDWKGLNADPAKREMYLADDEFQKLFGATKDAVAGWAKWKRDGKKKEHKLF